MYLRRDFFSRLVSDEKTEASIPCFGVDSLKSCMAEQGCVQRPSAPVSIPGSAENCFEAYNIPEEKHFSFASGIRLSMDFNRPTIIHPREREADEIMHFNILKTILFFFGFVALFARPAFADNAARAGSDAVSERIMALENQVHVLGREQKGLREMMDGVRTRLDGLEQALKDLTLRVQGNSKESARLLEAVNRVVADSADLAEQVGITAQKARRDNQDLAAAQSAVAGMVQKLEKSLDAFLTAQDLDAVSQKLESRLDALDAGVRALSRSGDTERQNLEKELLESRQKMESQAQAFEEAQEKLEFFRNMALANAEVLRTLNSTLSTVHSRSQQSLQSVQDIIWRRTLYGSIMAAAMVTVILLMLVVFRRRPGSSRPEPPVVRSDDEDLVGWLEKKKSRK
jgi:archaellum component FlaC